MILYLSTFLFTPPRPKPSFSGQDEFEYIISDGNGGTDVGTITVYVSATDNDGPIATDDDTSTEEDMAVVLDVVSNDSDPNSDPLTISKISSPPSNGTVTIVDANAGTIRYSPSLDFSGEDVFEYLISDGHGGTDVATVTITVNQVNDPPIATDDATSTDQGDSVSVNALLNDSDPENDPLTVTGVSLPSGGTVTIMNDTAGTIQYT